MQNQTVTITLNSKMTYLPCGFWREKIPWVEMFDHVNWSYDFKELRRKLIEALHLRKNNTFRNKRKLWNVAFRHQCLLAMDPNRPGFMVYYHSLETRKPWTRVFQLTSRSLLDEKVIFSWKWFKELKEGLFLHVLIARTSHKTQIADRTMTA